MFKAPTIEGIAFEVDNLKSYGTNYTERKEPTEAVFNYFRDAQGLISDLPSSYPSFSAIDKTTQKTIFVTGVTGFLGAFLLRDIFGRENCPIHVIAHVRAASSSSGVHRVKSACEAYGVWDEAWLNHLTVVTGDLEKERLGLSQYDWDKVIKEADLVVHNGAIVRRYMTQSC